jgi:hypothetical protein
MATIRRAKDTKGFSMSREIAQKRGMSFEARGVMSYLLSKSSNWEARIEDIEREANIGREKRRRIIAELERYGYLERRETRDEKGKIDYEIIVHEEALPESERTSETRRKPAKTSEPSTVQPQTGNPSTGKPSTVQPQTGNPSAYMNIEVPNRELHDKERPHTQTQRGVGVSGVSAGSAGSRFTIEECRKYAEYLKQTNQGITNPGGFATKVFRSGEHDSLIEAYLHPPVQVDPNKCPDCRGSGFVHIDPANFDRGVRPCKHAGLAK